MLSSYCLFIHPNKEQNSKIPLFQLCFCSPPTLTALLLNAPNVFIGRSLTLADVYCWAGNVRLVAAAAADADAGNKADQSGDTRPNSKVKGCKTKN